VSQLKPLCRYFPSLPARDEFPVFFHLYLRTTFRSLPFVQQHPPGIPPWQAPCAENAPLSAMGAAPFFRDAFFDLGFTVLLHHVLSGKLRLPPHDPVFYERVCSPCLGLRYDESKTLPRTMGLILKSSFNVSHRQVNLFSIPPPYSPFFLSFPDIFAGPEIFFIGFPPPKAVALPFPQPSSSVFPYRYHLRLLLSTGPCRKSVM